MNIWGKYERHIDIVAKIFMIIILLFICHRIVIYDAQISELTHVISEMESGNTGMAYGMPIMIGEPVQDTRVNEPYVPGIIVNITGAVKEPGVYTLEAGARLIDLVLLAGGALSDADLDRVNLAAHLYDASHIRIPFVDEEGDFGLISVIIDSGTQSGISHANSENTTGQGIININTASRAEFETLPGVGPVIAGNIVDFREANGSFNSLEDLMSVNRIGPALFSSIRHLIEL